MSTRRLRLTPYLLVALPIAVVPATAWQGPLASDSPGFTEAQASAGQVEFARKCAPCHAPDDGGERRAPALSGPSFRDKWGDRRVRQLFVRMRDGMPPVGVRPRGDGYTNILAFLLRKNGRTAGAEPLDPLSYDRLALGVSGQER
ncbi:MAG TPA: cytochrome c [Acidobacteria bacterium]|nr:cytochrome c [Acidobacteriota bacterium]